MKAFWFAVALLLSAAHAGQVQLERDVFDIAGELRCPVCRSESAADSNAESSIEFRNIIRERLDRGESRSEILAYFQARYGDWILLEPPRRGVHLLVWILPVAALLAGVALFIYFVRRWQHHPPLPELSHDERARVARELETH